MKGQKDEGPKVFKLLKNKLCLGFSQKVIPPRLISRRVLLPPANEIAGRSCFHRRVSFSSPWGEGVVRYLSSHVPSGDGRESKGYIPY